MEESGVTIREASPEAAPVQLSSWLCDDNDKPVVEYIHADDDGSFRLKVGAVWYERFGRNASGEWMYRRVR